jgi:hypothetical protein
MEVCSYWVETTMRITDRDLRLMERLVRAQDRRSGAAESGGTNRNIA